jgi:hypothetical protein
MSAAVSGYCGSNGSRPPVAVMTSGRAVRVRTWIAAAVTMRLIITVFQVSIRISQVDIVLIMDGLLFKNWTYCVPK